MTITMSRSRLTGLGTSVALACLALGAAACGDVPSTTTSEDTTNTGSALWSIDNTTLDSKSWDGGSDSHLTGWYSVGCVDDYGDDYILGGLNLYKEPSGNADNFVARLEATCRQYKDFAGTYEPTSVEKTAQVFSGNHRSPGETTAVPGGPAYAAGMNFNVNEFDGYVKDIQLLWVGKLPDSNALGGSTWTYDVLYETNYALGYWTGTEIHRQCPDQSVITSVSVRYSTNTGKIRQIKFGCRPLEFH